MIWVFTAVGVGACLGVLAGSSLSPRMRLLPLICTIALSVGAIVILIQIDPSNVLAAVLFVIVTVLASAIYSSLRWLQDLPDLGYSYGKLLVLELTRPGYLREQYRSSFEVQDSV